jgi:hypothetical protein
MTPNPQLSSTKSRPSYAITLLTSLGVGALIEHSLIGGEWWTENPFSYVGRVLGGALVAGALAYFPVFFVQGLLVQTSDTRNQKWPKRIFPAIVGAALLGVFVYDTVKLYLPYSGSARTAAIQEMTDGCLDTTKNSLPSATDEQRRGYCTCLSNTVIDKVTPHELRDLTEPSNAERLKTTLARYAKDCGNSLAEIQQLYEEAASINGQLPKKIDAITTLAKVEYSDNVFTYYYDIEPTAYQSQNWSVERLRKTVKTNACETFAGSLGTTALQSIRYVYNTGGRDNILIEVGEKDCAPAR